mmetsp:Transcript_26992/g.44501  ORF Transcript_26992/g.44501 Transcript_26992/m.44501 type:complete len:93 (-) Transcript_26992:904-1182(-)
MPYVGRDGTIGGPKSLTRTIGDFFAGIINFLALIFTSITNPPQRLGTQTYGQRNNGRTFRSGASTGGGGGGRNIRGVKSLQGKNCEARMGGG